LAMRVDFPDGGGLGVLLLAVIPVVGYGRLWCPASQKHGLRSWGGALRWLLAVRVFYRHRAPWMRRSR